MRRPPQWGCEDYEGTWADEFFLPLRKTLDDMLEESQPVDYRNAVGNQSAVAHADNPTALLNEAWEQFEQSPATYRAWERASIEAFLKSH